MSAHVQFINCRLSLIHIPIHLYAVFLKPILDLITTSSQLAHEHHQDGENGFADYPLSIESRFINISVTPLECSIVCSVKAGEELFAPILDSLAPEFREQVVFGIDSFLAIQVDGQGADASQRVLNLTSPLSLAGISIFFITTYFSDYLLVPSKSHNDVVRALEHQGFAFEQDENPFIAQTPAASMSFSSYLDLTPRTPPPATLPDLQSKTFTILRTRNINPEVHSEIKILLCAGQRDSSASDDCLYLGLVRCLLRVPKFLSLTITETEPPSLFLESGLMDCFPEPDVLLGNKQDILIPIILDLRQLPLESTGIVCGVAGKLAGVQAGQHADARAVEMSYLSTAMAGCVMVSEAELEQAVSALEV